MVSDTLVAVMLSAYLGAAGDYASLYQGCLEPAFNQNLWVTHPYYDDADFHQGAIRFDGVLYPSVRIRYNIFDNVLAVITSDSKYPVVPNPDKISYLEIDGKPYERIDGRFAAVEYGGNALKLLRLSLKRKATDIIKNGHAYHDLTSSEYYYLTMPDGSVHEVNNLKSVYKLMPQYKKLLKERSKVRGWKFGSSSRLLSLRECAALLDKQLCQDGAPVWSRSQGLVENVATAQTQFHARQEQKIPESIYIDLPRVSNVTAYQTYDNEKKIVFDDADEELIVDNPGISHLDPIRETRSLSEVEVVGFRQKIAQQVSGLESFRPSMLRNVPLAIGEADVLKLALMLPGVSSTGDASSGLNVRGGASDQNLLLMNGNTVFNPMHMFGIFSAFNPDLVSESELYKGGIPSQYGGRLSSVMNIKGRVADKKEFHGSASVGVVTAKALVEVPIIKDKMSLLLGGRTTYSDWMLKKLPSESGYRNGKAGFWDLGGSLHTQLNQNHSLVFNGYYSHDRFSLTQFNEYEYANMNFSAELRSRFGERLSTTITAGFDHYGYANEEREFGYSAARLSFHLSQAFVKGMGTYQLNDSHALNFGLQAQYYDLMPGSYQPVGDYSHIVGRELPENNAFESALWLEDSWSLTDELKLNGGVRLNLFKSFDPEGSTDLASVDVNPDLRLSLSYQINEDQSVKAGINTLHQYIHKVSNTVIMSPTDTWALSNSNIKPQSGWQVSAGYYWQSDDKVYEMSAETYYKGMDNYLTYRSAAQLVMNPTLWKDVVGTEGRAYGIELLLRKLHGKLNGWVSYTYARTQLRQAAEKGKVTINGGKWFSADYDSPHQFKLVGNYKMTRRYSCSLNADYSTGRPFTAPVGKFYSEQSGTFVPLYSDRNGCRMPYYLRVDGSFNIEPSHHLTNLTHSWFTFGVYNMLGRKNAYSIYYKSSGSEVQGYKLSIFGAPIPYISYNIKF